MQGWGLRSALFCPGDRLVAGIVEPAVVLFFQRLDHVVGVLVVGGRDAQLFAHPDERTREHIDLGMASGVEVLQRRVAGRGLDGTALAGHGIHPLHINAFGCGFSEGYGNDFDITKLRYDKIVIMADADVDGAHIATLIMTLFFRFMRPVIENGYLYIATPPLYSVKKGNKEQRYCWTDKELEQLVNEMSNGKGDAGLHIQRYKGLGEMSKEQLWETTMSPENRILRQVSIENAADADRIFSMLMGDDVPPRRQFIEQNATYATIDA